MNSLTFPEIPRSVLAYLLDLAGPPQALSPRSLLGEPTQPTRAQASELVEGRFIKFVGEGKMDLSPEFASVASVLLSPRTTVNIRTWGDDGSRGETSILFPRTVVEGRGVVFNQVDRNYRIRAFLADADVLELIRPHLPANEGPALEFETLVDPSTAAVLFGIMDLARDKTKAEVPAHDESSPTTLSLQKIYQYLTETWGLAGPKDFITYLAATGLAVAPPTPAEVVQAMISLGEAGVLVETSSGEYAVSPDVKALARLADGFQGGIQWKRTSLTKSGLIEKSNRIFLFGNGAPLLCFAPAADGLIWVTAVQKQDLVDFLDFEMTSRPPAGRAAGPKLRKKVPAEAPTQPAPAKCPHCGKPLDHPPPKPAMPVCASCGRELKPDLKFCTFCGAAAGTEKPASVSSPAMTKVCTKCGTSVRPTSKFCKTCGVPLS